MRSRSLITSSAALLHVSLHVILHRADGFRHVIAQANGQVSAITIQDHFTQAANNTNNSFRHSIIQTVGRVSATTAHRNETQSANDATGTQWTDNSLRHNITQVTNGSAASALHNFTLSVNDSIDVRSKGPTITTPRAITYIVEGVIVGLTLLYCAMSWRV